MVNEGTGGLSESATIAVFQDVFDRLGWPDSPISVLNYFKDRYLLRSDGNHVAFARSSFLHLFAAKRAMKSASFRSILLEKPIYYAAALTDYAALYRHDAELVREILLQLSSRIWTKGKSPLHEEVEHSQGLPQFAADDEHEDAPLASRTSNDDFFDASLDLDAPPFPVMEEHDVPNGIQLLRTLDLVSTVIRDSDQVEDLQLKEEALRLALTSWGELMDAIYEDRSFKDFVRIVFASDDKESLEPEEIEEITRAIPASMSLGGIDSTLASRKLVVVFKKIVDRGDLSEHETISAAFFIFVLREQGWVQDLRQLLESRHSTWLVRNFLMHLLVRRFVEEDSENDDKDALLDLCAEIWQSPETYATHAEKVRDEEKLKQTWRQRRLAVRTRALAEKKNSDLSTENPS